MEHRRLKIRSGGVLDSEAFFEASREELRVLVAIMQNPLKFSSGEEIAEAARVSRARAQAAVTLFLEEGLIVREGDVTLEFEPRERDIALIDRRAGEIAEIIRKKNLAGLFADIAEMMGDESLGRDETEKLASLIRDLVLTEEYVMILAQYLKSRDKLSVKNLLAEADKLDRADIHTAERLEEYINGMEASGSLEWEFRSTFKKYVGKLAKCELDYFRKWTETYGFSRDVILFALDMNVLSKTSYSYPYMDTLLTSWHESGCRTLEDCERQHGINRERIAAEIKSKEIPREKKEKKSAAPTPRFGNFDPNEALERAIAKSFAKVSPDDEK